MKERVVRIQWKPTVTFEFYNFFTLVVCGTVLAQGAGQQQSHGSVSNWISKEIAKD